jgi:hypothetical protein
MKPAEVLELTTTQLVITGLHEEIERLRAENEELRARVPVGHAVVPIDPEAFAEACRELAQSPPQQPPVLIDSDDADLWRAKAVQLAAALEVASDLAEGFVTTMREINGMVATLPLDGIAGMPEARRESEEALETATGIVQRHRALLAGDLAEPLAKLKRLREAVAECDRPTLDRADVERTGLSGDALHQIELREVLAAAREVVR